MAALQLAPCPTTAADAAQRLFLVWRERLHSLLPHAQVEHIGATAIPGCLTKGDLDIAVYVEQEYFAEAEQALASLLRSNSGSIRTTYFSSFSDENTSPAMGVQLVVRGSALDIFGPFRDRLRADPALLQRYNTLKLSHQGVAMSAYREAKAAFIESVLER